MCIFCICFFLVSFNTQLLPSTQPDRESARVFEGTWQRYVCVGRPIVCPQVAPRPQEVCITSLVSKHDQGTFFGTPDGEAHGVFITVIPDMWRKTREYGLKAKDGEGLTCSISNRRDFTPRTPSAGVARADSRVDRANSLPGIGGSAQKKQKVSKNLFSFGFGSSSSSSA